MKEIQDYVNARIAELEKEYEEQLELLLKKTDELKKFAEEQNKEIKIWTIAMWGLAMLLLTLFIVNLT